MTREDWLEVIPRILEDDGKNHEYVQGYNAAIKQLQKNIKKLKK